MPNELISFRLTPSEITALGVFKMEGESNSLAVKRLLFDVISGHSHKSSSPVISSHQELVSESSSPVISSHQDTQERLVKLEEAVIGGWGIYHADFVAPAIDDVIAALAERLDSKIKAVSNATLTGLEIAEDGINKALERTEILAVMIHKMNENEQPGVDVAATARIAASTATEDIEVEAITHAQALQECQRDLEVVTNERDRLRGLTPESAWGDSAEDLRKKIHWMIKNHQQSLDEQSKRYVDRQAEIKAEGAKSLQKKEETIVSQRQNLFELHTTLRDRQAEIKQLSAELVETDDALFDADKAIGALSGGIDTLADIGASGINNAVAGYSIIEAEAVGSIDRVLSTSIKVIQAKNIEIENMRSQLSEKLEINFDIAQLTLDNDRDNAVAEIAHVRDVAVEIINATKRENESLRQQLERLPRIENDKALDLADIQAALGSYIEIVKAEKNPKTATQYKSVIGKFLRFIVDTSEQANIEPNADAVDALEPIAADIGSLQGWQEKAEAFLGGF